MSRKVIVWRSGVRNTTHFPVFRMALGTWLLLLAGCQDSPTVTAPVGQIQASRLQALGFDFSSISAGANGACGVTAGGAAYCWGDNSNGTLGNGTNDPSGVPVQVSGGLTFASVSGNTLVTCGLTKNGQAYCWGVGAFGGLGDGTFGSTTVPVPVSGGLTFTTLASARVGLGFSCGTTRAGQAYCWGIDGEGELGNGSSTPGVNFENPVPVSGNLKLTHVTTGGFHTCGLTKAGQVYCWGNNSSGELGLGYFSTPVNVPVPTSSGLIFVQLSAGSSYTCGVTKSGAGYCWGANFSGQLGNGTTTSHHAPVAVSGGLAFASISAGETSTCGVTKTGQAFCWGSNVTGQLGIGTTGIAPVPVPTTVAGGFTFSSISVGAGFACGITTRLGAFCWGTNANGQLGSGLTVPFTDAPTPVAP